MTILDIAEDMIAFSDGACNIYESPDFEALGAEDRTKVMDLFHEDIENCEGCGWLFHRDSMDYPEHACTDGPHCWRCAEDIEEAYQEEQEEEEDDE